MGLNVYSDKWYIFKNRSTARGRSRVGSRGDEAVDQDARGDGNVERIHAPCLVDAGGNGDESVARATNVGAQTGTFVAHDEKRRRGDDEIGDVFGASVGVNVSAAGSTTPAAGVDVLRDDLTTEDQAAGLLGRAVSLADHTAGHVGRAVSFLPIAGKSCGEARRKR